MLKRILTGFVLTVMLTGAATAGPSEEGWAAFERGDYATALRLWRPLAAQGNAFAQSNLGFMYDTGQGVPQDYVQAHMWADLAASRFPPSATEDRDQAVKGRDFVPSKMTPAQLAEAQRLVRDWKPK